MTANMPGPAGSGRPTIGQESFRRVYRHVPLPVAIVLTDGIDGVVRGVTCTSATSLSADPPMAVFSVDDKTAFADEVRASGAFSINYLAADRASWARAFAGAGASLDRLAGALGRGRCSSPVLQSGTTVVLECWLVQIVQGGDHWMVSGVIAHARWQADTSALLFCGGRYGGFAATDQSVAGGPTTPRQGR